MQSKKVVHTLLGTLGPLTLGGQPVRGQGKAAPSPVQTHAVITYMAKHLSKQHDLVFLALPKKKAGFERIIVQTEVANSEIAAPDNVWVPAAGN